MPDIKSKMARGAVWMVLFKFAERSLGLVSTLILARLLGPSDFGIVAMALSFIVMAELLSAFGFDVAIIQKQDATEAHYSTAWTCNVLLGASITALMLALAAPIATFYRNPEVLWVVCALALGPLISGAENIGVVAFRKELDFRREFRFQIVRKVFGIIVVVPLAFLLRNHWALVAGILVSKLAGTVTSYRMHPFRPRLTLSQRRELFAFSRWLLLMNLVGFVKERWSDVFLGRLFGPTALGTYNIAHEIAHLPTTEIGAPINRALLPGFAKMSEHGEVATAYSAAVSLLALAALPLAFGMSALAPFLVPVVMGPKWLEAVALMEILAFSGAVRMFHASIATVLVGRGFPRAATLTGAVYIVVLLALFVLLASPFGAIGAAYAVLATSLISTPIYLQQLRRYLGVPSSLFFTAVARPIAAASLAALVVRLVLPAHSIEMSWPEMAGWLATGTACGLAIYVTAAWVLWRLAGRPDGAERLVIDGLDALRRRALGRSRAAPQGGG